MPEKKKDTRARTWSFVVYPESAPKNWRDIVDSNHIAWVESPLHDKDKNPDGTTKKPHWHIMLLFDGKKSYDQIKEIADSVNSPMPQRVKSPKGLVRYMIHMDNPEKYQYKREDIIAHGGADVDAYFELSASSKDAILWEMIAYIRENKVTSFAKFMGHIQDSDDHDWFEIATRRNTLAIKAMIESNYQDLVKRRSPEEQVKKMHDDGTSIREIASLMGLSKTTVHKYLHK